MPRFSLVLDHGDPSSVSCVAVQITAPLTHAPLWYNHLDSRHHNIFGLLMARSQELNTPGLSQVIPATNRVSNNHAGFGSQGTPQGSQASQADARGQTGDRKKDGDGYIPMNWVDDGGRNTRLMLEHIKEDTVLRQSLYPGQGEETTSMTATKCHQQIAEHLLKDDPRYADVWPRLKVKYGLAVKCRLHKLYEAYVHKRAILNNSGAGLSDADRAKFPDVNNLQELVRKLFIWYDAMDEFCHERAVVGLDSLCNSDDPADITVLGVTRRGDEAETHSSKRQRPGSRRADPELSEVEDSGKDPVGEDGTKQSGDVDEANNEENIPRTRGARSAPVDLGPISQAIRDGDLLRDAIQKDRLLALDRSKTLDREAKERKAHAVLEYKMKRDQLRSEVAKAKFQTEQENLRIKSDQEIRLKELELESMRVRVREHELALERRHMSADVGSVNSGGDSHVPGAQSSGNARGHHGSSLSHLLL